MWGFVSDVAAFVIKTSIMENEMNSLLKIKKNKAPAFWNLTKMKNALLFVKNSSYNLNWLLKEISIDFAKRKAIKHSFHTLKLLT